MTSEAIPSPTASARRPTRPLVRCEHGVTIHPTVHRLSDRFAPGGPTRPGGGRSGSPGLKAAGIPDRNISILRGVEGADRLDGTGARNGVIARLRRSVSFTIMDQLVDMALYERAVRDGQVVLMAKVRGDDRKAAAIAALRGHGAHFINYYGRLVTEEVERWRGPEPDVPGLLRR